MSKAYEEVKDPVPSYDLLHLNNYQKRCFFINPDPVVIMASILRDLTILLEKYNCKGNSMFYYTQKSKLFYKIEEQIASLQSKGFLKSNDGRRWLRTDEERLSFFINLHNFLVLFGLCKYKRMKIPNTQLEWTKFRKSLLVKIAGYTFSAFEIEHAVLRASMDSPNLPSPYLDTEMIYPKFKSNDPRLNLVSKRKEGFLEFALYIPTKSSPPLRIYKADKVVRQIKLNVEKYIVKNVKVNQSKGTLLLPALFKWYSTDFTKGDDAEDLLLSITNLLISSESKKLKNILVTSAIKEVKYDKYNWNYFYEYLAD